MRRRCWYGLWDVVGGVSWEQSDYGNLKGKGEGGRRISTNSWLSGAHEKEATPGTWSRRDKDCGSWVATGGIDKGGQETESAG